MEAGDGIIISAVAENGMIVIATVSIFETRTDASREENGRPLAPMVAPRRYLLCEAILMVEVAVKETAEEELTSKKKSKSARLCRTNEC
jgi:hypothetical protein